MTPDDLARVMNEVERRCDDLVVDAIRGGWFEGRGAHRLDALVDMARPGSADPAGPDSMIHVMVDYEALMRGHTVAGEQTGIGPIPVTLARQLSEDAILKGITTRRPSSATRTAEGQATGDGSRPRTSTRTSPSCARSSPAPAAAETRRPLG
jgi:hypothetical protein